MSTMYMTDFLQWCQVQFDFGCAFFDSGNCNQRGGKGEKMIKL